jgi:hypothetical protein
LAERDDTHSYIVLGLKIEKSFNFRAIAEAIRLLKKITGVRQIETTELMVSANNFTTGYADALVLGTPKNQLANRTTFSPQHRRDGW